jgi:putative Mn2+ efflux pump MntP
VTIELVITAAALGVGLAMDAFSVSLANGLAEPKMSIGRTMGIAGIYALFQFAMPMIGWFLVEKVAEKFEAFRPFIPWIALILLLLIGGGMLKDGIEENRSKKDKNGSADEEAAKSASGTGYKLSFGALIMQGVATSIDALSVGFTISEYAFSQAICSALIIGVVTFAICMAGLRIGRRLGTILAGKASIFGGVILIIIGLEIWVRGVFL